MALHKDKDPATLDITLKNLIDQFKDPFPATQIEYRAIQWNKDNTQAMPFAYLNARAVMDRLDEVLGGRWALNTEPVPSAFGNEKVCVKATIIIYADDGVYSRSGFGEEDLRFGKDSDKIINDPWKSAESDAIKRAAIAWGIGRYLYDCPKVWMAWEGDRYYGHFKQDPATKLFDGDGYPLPKNDPFEDKGGDDESKDTGRTRRGSSRDSARKEEADEAKPVRSSRGSADRTAPEKASGRGRAAGGRSSSKAEFPDWLNELTGETTVDGAVQVILDEIEAAEIAPLPTDKQVKYALDLAIKNDHPLDEEIFEYAMPDFQALIKELTGGKGR